MMLTWKEELQEKLVKKFGSEKGVLLSRKYAASFPNSYCDENTTDTAINDIGYAERLSPDNRLEIDFYLSKAKDIPLHLRLFQWEKPLPLSDVLPMLENLDLRTDNERPYKMILADQQIIWISDFSVVYVRGTFDIDVVRESFKQAFTKLYFGTLANDGFNKLILGAGLSWQEVKILRTYAKYLRQVGFRFTQPYIEQALINNANITKDLIAFFSMRHDPDKVLKTQDEALRIEKSILQALVSVSSLDEDRIIRRMLDLIQHTLRTNYFQITKDHQQKEYIAIKLNSRHIPELPLPVPLYEIFVYSPRFEAIHLRNTKVARGGIRWSDRPEDFRTEILGLMKAQTVKNAVIVPSGAKGGFILKTMPTERDSLQKEVIDCYKSFISGLLDLTDNIKDNQFIPPKDVVCYDEPDPYLVVAADKGTAAFSDIANQISSDYQFWLSDAFASGGKTGYDHKKMGITAKGAWESIKRHFRELNIDIMHHNITVIGIGDMSGDVFGNGLTYSKQVKLVAAFDHRHIFLDPTPDPEISYYERLRLFNLPSSSWEDYNPKLISPGGGVFKRSLKSIVLTPEMKKMLNTGEAELTPNDLIKAILTAPVDLLFNGGIGTYVKETVETNTDVSDRANDYCRVNGSDLRCQVVGEGGNLGFTQRGRVEFAKKGGLINTDFIDNSAGVDCSDHEVNLKILLDTEVRKGKLSFEARNQLLASLTSEVAGLVLHDNYQQALVMSFSAFHAKKNISLHTNYIKELESQDIIKRKVEFLPDDKELLERKAAEEGLTRPELAVLLAYTKIHVKKEILKSNLPEDPYLSQLVQSAFPPSIKSYKSSMEDHRLKRDIIATQLSNQVINGMGITFVYRQQMETGATVAEIVRAHAVASRVFDTQSLQHIIESLDFKIPMSEQYDMLFNIRTLVNLGTRWFLRAINPETDLEKIIDHYSSKVTLLENLIPDLMSGYTKEYLSSLTEKFLEAGLSKEIARHIATYRAIYTSLNIIDVASRHQFDLIKTAKVYFASGERLNLVWFRDQIATDTREGHWNILAKLTLRDELDVSQRALTIAILKMNSNEPDVNLLIEKWLAKNRYALERWEKLLALLHASTSTEYTMFFIALRELIGWISVNSSLRADEAVAH